jgi:hypothetical protein
MNQTELAKRWKLSPRTLERWRWLGQGPQFLKIGGRVIYRVVDIEEYELAMIRYAKSDISHSQPSFASFFARPRSAFRADTLNFD